MPLFVSDCCFAAQAGICFGLSGTACRVGFVAAASVTLLAAPLGLACSILLSSLGFVLQTVGLKDGHTLIVCTCAAVASISTGQPCCCLALRSSAAVLPLTARQAQAEWQVPVCDDLATSALIWQPTAWCSVPPRACGTDLRRST